MPKQTQDVLPASTKPWAEAPLASVYPADEVARQLEFGHKTVVHSRLHDDELGRPHSKGVRIQKQAINHEPLTTAESQARRSRSKDIVHAKRKRQLRRLGATAGIAFALAGGTEAVTGYSFPVAFNHDVPASHADQDRIAQQLRERAAQLAAQNPEGNGG